MVLTDIGGVVDAELNVAMQTSLWGNVAFSCGPICQGVERLDAESWVLFEPGWVCGSDALFEQLRTDMPWRATKRPMYDRVVPVPRLICGLATNELAVDGPLATMAAALEEHFNVRFDSVGLNYYRDGRDSVAWHSDKVGRDRSTSTVVLVSLGSPRQLRMRRSGNHEHRRWSLGNGDLLVMGGACQRDWEHAVPKQADTGARISLAFRSRSNEGPR